MQGGYSAFSEYTLAVRGFKRSSARLNLALKRTSSRESNGFPWAVNEHVLKMLPLNEEFDKLFSDILTTQMLLSHLELQHSQLIALKFTIGNDSRYWRVPASILCVETPRSVDPLAVIRDIGSVLLRPCSTISIDCGHVLSFADGTYAIDGTAANAESVLKLLDESPDDTALVEWAQAGGVDQPFSAYVIKICGFETSHGEVAIRTLGVFDITSNRGIELHGGSACSHIAIPPTISEDAKRAVKQILTEYPELEYVCGWFTISKLSPALIHVDTGLDMALSENPSPEILDELERIFLRNRPATPRKAIRSYVKELTEVYAERKGYQGFMYRNWIRGIIEDYKSADTAFLEKLWAHKRGFYSYRIEQYGLTDTNAGEFLSDLDYKRLRPLNGPYQKWLWDKVSTFLVMRPFARYMPMHYCRIIGKQDSRIVPFYQSGIDSIPSIIALLELTEVLAVKRAIGSHGNGFHKLEHRGVPNEYYLDGNACNAHELARFFKSLDDEYMVTEYVVMHPFFASLYGDVVSTVRIMAIRTDKSFKLYDAYVRIGTSSTGNTDNLAGGGIVAKVDLQSGRLSDPELIAHHRFIPCIRHPDSGVEIAGVIPCWDEVKQQIERMCMYLFPLEYLGFDAVITPDGFKILEINTHQDLHKFAYYPDIVKSYLLGKRNERGA